MILRKLHAGLTLLLVPGFALAFEAVDTLPYTSTGRFPAYPVEAPPRPTTIWVQGGVLRDSNVLRLSNNPPAPVPGFNGRSDTVTRLGAGIRHEQRVFGRQSVRLEARGDQYQYSRYSALNNLSYGLLGEWRWELGNDVSGTLGYSRRRILIDLGEVQAPVKDQITEDDWYGTAAYRFAADWRVRGGLERIKRTRDLSAAASGDVNTAIAGIDYVTPNANAVGLEYRRSEGDFFAPQLVGTSTVTNRFHERELAGVVTYAPGTQLRLAGRLGRTRRTHDQLPVRDFSGGTGRITVDWMPGNKTILGFAAYKEARSIVDIAASYVLVKGVAFGPSWSPTAKIVLSARLIQERRQFLGDPGVPLLGLPQRDETLRGVRLAAGWELMRSLELGVGWDHGRRSSNIAGRDYDYNAVMANLRYGF